MKDKIDTTNHSNIIYNIPCCCGCTYIGQSSQLLKNRLKQYQYDIKNNKTNTGLSQHCFKHKHLPLYNDTKILNTESILSKRLFLEAAFINCIHNNCNKQIDFTILTSHTLIF